MSDIFLLPPRGEPAAIRAGHTLYVSTEGGRVVARASDDLAALAAAGWTVETPSAAPKLTLSTRKG